MSGVGSGTAKTDKAFTFPAAVTDVDGNAHTFSFDTPICESEIGKHIPPLWGLRSLREHRALIDCQGLKLHLLGPGDLQLNLPPGSESFLWNLARVDIYDYLFASLTSWFRRTKEKEKEHRTIGRL